MCVCMYIYVYKNIFPGTWHQCMHSISLSIYIYTHTQTYIHTYIHTYIETGQWRGGIYTARYVLILLCVCVLILVHVRQVNGTVPGSAKEMTSDQVNPKFTCFTGKKVQILTPTRLPGVHACACRHFQERAAELRAGLPVKDDGAR